MAAKHVLRHSAWICWKDLTEFSRSRLRLVMLVLMPLFMMVMVGFIFPSASTLSHQPVALANQDAGYEMPVPPGNTTTVFLGQACVQQLEAINNQTGMMDLTPAADFNDIKGKIQNGEVYGGIIFPPNFTANLMSGRQGEILIVTDQSNPQVSLTIQTVLSKTLEGMGTYWAMLHYNVSLAEVKPYAIQFTGIVPSQPNYFQFVAPGIISMVVMMSLMTGLPHAISYEKDIGTLDGMLVAPINRLSIILGKVMAQTIRGLVQGFIILGLAIGLFGVVIYGNFLLVVGLLLLTVFSFVGLGILITSFTEKEETATMVMMTLMFPMMFLSGVFFPIAQMPWYMQDIAHVLPLTYATDAMRKVMVLGAGLSSVALEIGILLVFGVILLGVAVPMFKKAMSR